MSLPDWSDENFTAAQPLMDYWADQYGIPRALVYGLVSQESRFLPNASGDNGLAFGLTQVHYDTAQGVGYGGAAAGLYDPSTNLQYGLAYLAQKIAQYGDLDQAVSAYNAGHYITGNQSYVDNVNTRAAYFTAPDSSDDGDSGDAGDDASGSPWLGIALGALGVAAFVVIARRVH